MRSIVALLALTAGPLGAQEFVPPEVKAEAPHGGVRFGLFGFGTRLGADFKDENQAVLSVALDVGDIYSSRVRLRPSAELGFGGGSDTYLGNLELMYRFASDSQVAVPYIGFGVGVWGQQGCAAAAECPSVFAQFALGFELRFRDHINWLLEYHGEDSLRRHRLFIGLTTRRGS